MTEEERIYLMREALSIAMRHSRRHQQMKFIELQIELSACKRLPFITGHKPRKKATFTLK